MRVTKLFEITFDEPSQDWLSDNNLKFILESALLSAEGEDAFNFDIRDLTNRDYYLRAFHILKNGEVQEEGTPIETPPSSIESETPATILNPQERNEEIKKRKEKERPPAPPHNTPGKGTLCKSPEVLREKLSTGGSITFCPSCGFQYSDTDLIQ